MVALIKTTSLSGYWELVDELGGSPEELLRQSALEPEAVSNLEGVISHRAEITALENAARELHCRDFGLRLAERQDLYILGPVAAVALTASSVGDALDRISERLHWFSPTANLRVRREVSAGKSLILYHNDPSLPRYRSGLEHAVGVLRNIMYSLCGKGFRPLEVYFSFASPIPAQRYTDFFKAPVRFEQEQDGFLVNSSDLNKPLNPPSQELRRLLGRFTREVLPDYTLDLGTQVETIVENLLPTRNCCLNTIAAQLGFNPRTLQRELAADGKSFEKILDSARQRLADELLSNQEMPLIQVAALLGYSEQSTFSRACKRWFGCSPLQRRKQLRH